MNERQEASIASSTLVLSFHVMCKARERARERERERGPAAQTIYRLIGYLLNGVSLLAIKLFCIMKWRRLVNGDSNFRFRSILFDCVRFQSISFHSRPVSLVSSSIRFRSIAFDFVRLHSTAFEVQISAKRFQ